MFTRFAAVLILVAASCGDNIHPPDKPTMPQCSDGIDNDGDGMIDYPADPGCDDVTDDSEDSAAKPKCMDGRDNDGDGKVDFPDDPGCVAPNADDETDDCPDGPNCPQCANGKDDDGNGLTDFPQDVGCSSASDTEEFIHNPVACGDGMTVKTLPLNGMDSGMLDGTSVSQLMSPCGGGGGSSGVAYELHLSEPKVVVATTEGSAADTVIDLRGVLCKQDASELACNDDVDATNTTSSLTKSLPAGNYYIIVEGHDSTSTGAYNLKVSLFGGEGTDCTDTSECGPGLVCRIPLGGTTKKCEPHVCSDNVDDDGDGKLDFPTDPGCDSPLDDDETDDCPNGPNCPACANGIDDDGDGKIDFPDDTSCSAASAQSESCNGEQDPIAPIVSATTMADATGAHDDHDPSCGSSGGVDRLFTLKVPRMQSLSIDTNGSTFDTLLSLLPATCGEPSLDCDDDGGTDDGASLLEFTNLAAGSYVVAVDGFSSSTTPGPFAIHVSGTIAPGGKCDTGSSLGGALVCPASNPCIAMGADMVCRPNQCADGVDNDGDGKMDFPNDPGCTSIDDDDETDSCPGAGCPQCADGIDNDGDGQIDFPLDTSCTSASGPSESCSGEQDPVLAITSGTTTGTLVGAHDDHQPACSSGTGGPDVQLTLTVPALTSLRIDTEGSAISDTVLSLLPATCAEPSLACDDDSGTGNLSTLTASNLAAGTYFVAVDAFSSSTTLNTFTVHVDGTIANGASCEGTLASSGALHCAAGATCSGPAGARVCQGAPCSDGVDNDGDGLIDFPNDPGCDSPADNDEADACPGAGCPACGNGVDDDADGKIDFAMDKSCWAASAPSEAFCNANTDRAILITDPTMTGTTTATANDFASQSCQSSAGGGDLAFALVLPVKVASLSIDTDTSAFDTVLSVRDATCGTELSCDDDGGEGTRSLVTLTNVDPGTYAVVLDGFSSGSGNFALHTHGTVANGTACTSPLFTTGVLSCTAPATCTAGTCQ